MIFADERIRCLRAGPRAAHMVDGDRGAAFSCQFHIDFGCSMGPLPEGRVWFYWHDGAPSGPATLDELVGLLRRRILPPDTPIRHPGMADYQPARVALEPLRGKYRPAAPSGPAAPPSPAPANVPPAAAPAAPAAPPRPAPADAPAEPRTAPAAALTDARPLRPSEAAQGASAAPPAAPVPAVARDPAFPAPPSVDKAGYRNPQTAPVAENDSSRSERPTSAPPAVAVPDDVPAPRVTPDQLADAAGPAVRAERVTRFEPIDTTERVPSARGLVDHAPVVPAAGVPTYEPVRDAHGDLRAEYVEPIETVAHPKPGDHGEAIAPAATDHIDPDHSRHGEINPHPENEAARERPADSDWVATVAPATSATHVSTVEPAVPARHVFAAGSVPAANQGVAVEDAGELPTSQADDLDVEVVSGQSSPAPVARPKSKAGWYVLAALIIIGGLGWLAYPYAGGLLARAGVTQPDKPAPAVPAPVAARPSGADVTILLPHNISMQVPNDWITVNDDGRSDGDKAKAAAPPQDTIDARRDTVYAANRYDEKSEPIGILNAGFYPEEVTQKEVADASDADISALDKLLRGRIEKSTNGTLIGWTGTQRTTLNGLTALVSEYRRQSGATVFRVRLVRVFDAAQSFTVAVAYREDRADVLKPVTDRIIARIARTP